MERILICDDERDIVNALSIYLETEGYETVAAYNGRDALHILRSEPIDLVLLDIMMPDMDGITTLCELRRHYNTPVILLTAKSEDADKVLGLNVGADDYVVKPFQPTELMARVRSQLRRYLTLGSAVKPHTLRVGGISVENDSKQVTVDGTEIHLTPREYDILLHLMSHVNTVFSPKELYRAVWKEEPFGAENAVTVHIRHLREKIEINPAEPHYIKVVWGKGYKMEG